MIFSKVCLLRVLIDADQNAVYNAGYHLVIAGCNETNLKLPFDFLGSVHDIARATNLRKPDQSELMSKMPNAANIVRVAEERNVFEDFMNLYQCKLSVEWARESYKVRLLQGLTDR